MRMRLCEVTLAEFMELACGNTAILLEKGESTEPSVLSHIANNILTEYSFIADRTNARAKMRDKEDIIKRDSVLLLLKICNTLLMLEKYDDVRDLLKEIDEYAGESDEKLKAKVDRLIRLNEFEKKRATDIAESEKVEQTQSTPEEIRSSFYSEIAFLMTYFKMNIEANNVNAEVYANLVRQAEMEIRARLAKK